MKPLKQKDRDPAIFYAGSDTETLKPAKEAVIYHSAKMIAGTNISMKQIVIGFGLLIFSLLVLFRVASYTQFRLLYGTEIWIAAFSILFLVLGVLISRNMFRKEIITEREVFVEVPAKTGIDQEQLAKIGLSKREYEILQLITEGLSNQQIAGKLYVSENTIKKHISNLFLKLDVERRTEAVKKAKELRVI